MRPDTQCNYGQNYTDYKIQRENIMFVCTLYAQWNSQTEETDNDIKVCYNKAIMRWEYRHIYYHL